MWTVSRSKIVKMRPASEKEIDEDGKEVRFIKPIHKA